MFIKVVKAIKKFNAFMDTKVTAYGISLRLLLNFTCLLLMALCIAAGSQVDKWIPVLIVMDTIWSYLSEKKKNNPYFPGE